MGIVFNATGHCDRCGRLVFSENVTAEEVETISNRNWGLTWVSLMIEDASKTDTFNDGDRRFCKECLDGLVAAWEKTPATPLEGWNTPIVNVKPGDKVIGADGETYVAAGPAPEEEPESPAPAWRDWNEENEMLARRINARFTWARKTAGVYGLTLSEAAHAFAYPKHGAVAPHLTTDIVLARRIAREKTKRFAETRIHDPEEAHGEAQAEYFGRIARSKTPAPTARTSPFDLT